MKESFDFGSNHWLVASNYIPSTPNTLPRKQSRLCVVNWSPSESWFPRVGEFSADWSDPWSAFGQWAQIARDCRLPIARKFDFRDNFQELLRLRRQHLDADWQHAIYKRRNRQRIVRFQALKDARAYVQNVDMSIWLLW